MRMHCKDCNKSLNETGRIWNNRGEAMPRCPDCHRKSELARRQKYNLRDYWLKGKYNLTEKEFDKLAEFQQGGCAICRKPCPQGNLSVDHDHETREIRGLLCRRCNSVIGLINEDEELLLQIIDYLKRTTWKKSVA